jgi:hypothetical protein
MFTTISISSAPSSIASWVSNSFTLVTLFPNGNPTTVATRTSLFFSISDANLTYNGLTHTALNLYSNASSQIFLTSLFFASGYNIV